jgi:hypothetical protein
MDTVKNKGGWLVDNNVKIQTHNTNNPCPAQPGTVLRIYFPPGMEINLLNIVEVSSPGGICLIVRLPFLAETANLSAGLTGIIDTFKKAGAQVTVMNE